VADEARSVTGSHPQGKGAAGVLSRKEQILHDATRLFADKGFRETSMTTLSRMSGVAGGTIFYHFKTKEELFYAVLDSVKESIRREFDGFLRDKQFASGLAMLEAAVSYYLYAASTQEEHFLLLHRDDVYELAKTNPVCREHIKDICNCLVDVFERAILLGQADGSIRPLPPRHTALIIYATVDGLARFKTFQLYHVGALYNELMDSCRRILQKDVP